MSVPEATMHEDNGLMSRENEVWPAGQAAAA